MRVPQPAGGFEKSHTRAQAFRYDVRCRFQLGFQPHHAVLGMGEGCQQRMIVIGFSGRFARAEEGRAGGCEIRFILGLPHRLEPEIFVFLGVSRHLDRASVSR
jgi:hypothetical protein